MGGAKLDDQRVTRLLGMLRQRTPKEISFAVLSLGGCFSPEMWRALELSGLERSTVGESRGLPLQPPMGERAMRRRPRFKSSDSFRDRLAAFAADARAQASRLPPGPERKDLIQRAGQTDAAADIDEWARERSSEPNISR
jgi:hypothetical protein